MAVLSFKILGQIISPNSSKSIVSDSIDYWEMEFTYSPEWAEATGVYATLQKVGSDSPLPTLLVIDGKITKEQHLNFTAGDWTFFITGVNANGQRITTKPITLSVYDCGDGVDNINLPLTIGEQLIAMMTEANTNANEAKAEAALTRPFKEASEAAAIRAESARDTAISAQNAAETAKEASETAQELSEQAATTSIAAKNEAIQMKNIVEQTAIEVEENATDAVNSANAALSLKNETEQLKSDTETLKSEADAIKTDTQGLKDDVISLKSDTQTLKEQAETAKAQAEKYAKFGTFSLEGNMLVATIEAVNDIDNIEINEEGHLVITLDEI